VKSTPARALREGQLLVDRYAVNKITKVQHPLPHNTVRVQLVNQMTGEQSTRDLRWDSQHTTEEAFEVPIGETGKIRVELALLASYDDSPVYRYKITDPAAGIDHEDLDLHLDPNHRPDNLEAAKALLQFLGATSEAFITGHELEADVFPEDVNFWSHQMSDEILMAQLGLGEGLETER
jgi:hypothetical protein